MDVDPDAGTARPDTEAGTARPDRVDAVLGAGLALLALVVAGALGAGLAGVSLGVDPLDMVPGEDLVYEQALYAWSLPLQALLIGGLVWSLVSRMGLPLGGVLGLNRARHWWAVALVVPAGVCSDGAVRLARSVVPGAELGSLGDLSQVAQAPGLVGAALVVGLVLLGPLSEEVLFRGLVFRGLLHDRGTRQAIGLSALMFGLFHIDPVHVVGAVVLGFYLGWLRALCGSLIPVVVAHALNNGIWVALVRSGRSDVELPLAAELMALGVCVVAVVLTRDALGRTGG